jgi:hypothetical protein
VRLDGREVLAGEGERLRVEAQLPIGRGLHAIEVRQQRERRPELRAEGVRGHRLAVGWVAPETSGAPGRRRETIPLRQLGPEGSAFLWKATDALAVLLALLVGAVVWVAPWADPLPLPASRPVTRAEFAASALGLATILAAMSWPLLRHPLTTGPLDRVDGMLNTWILAWDAHALAHAPTRVFEAPMFHPAPDALAFSENLLLPALLAAPASWLGQPVLGYNLVYLVSALVSGLGVHLLVRRAGGDGFGAFVAGALFAAGAHRFVRVAHLQQHVTLFLPLVLLALDRYFERRTLPRALVIGALLALQGLSSVYVGAVAATAVAAVLGLALLAGRLASRDLMRLLAGGLLAAALLAPAALPYLRVRAEQGGEWSLADVELHAATADSYLASASWLYEPISRRHLDPEHRGGPLFPGLVPLGLGIAGLARVSRRHRAAALAIAGAGLLLSLGPETAVYRALHDNVVLVRGIRALGRFSLLPVLALCALSGCALAGRRRAAALALLLGLAEAAAPLSLGAWSGPGEASRWLAGRPGAVLYWPLRERDAEVLLEQTAHFRPILNGYSGFTPRHYDWMAEALDDLGNPDAPRLLRALCVTHVVSLEDLPLPLLERFGEERVYGVPAGEAARAVAAGAPLPALWDATQVTVDLGAARSVSRLAFEPGDGRWSGPPRLAVSEDGRSFRDVPVRVSLSDLTLSLIENPRDGLGEIRFAPVSARFLRLTGLQARAGSLWVAP